MIQKITQSEIDERAVASLSDRPGAPGRYGTGGLSAGQLKAHFDKLALLAIAKLNELIDALHGAGQGDPLIDEMTTHAVSLVDDRENMPLSDWIEQVETLLGLDGTGGLPARIAALEALQVPEETPAAELLSGHHPDLVAGLAENLCGRENDATGACFTHRPTRDAGDVGKGNAALRSLHGSTLVWNQLCQNGDFADADGWNFVSASGSVSGNVATVTPSSTSININRSVTYVASHKILYLVSVKSSKATDVQLGDNASVFGKVNLSANAWTQVAAINTSSASSNQIRIYFGRDDANLAGTDEVKIRNVQVFDLTKMFGAGREPTAAEFCRLFPLPYYAYDAGRLLHFAGTGLRTVGFNACHNGEAYVLGGREYQITGAYTALSLNGVSVTPVAGFFTPSENGTLTVTGGDETTCVHLTHSGWRNGEYEPYWTSTLALPVATYFPTGMKSAGTAFDELTEKKAVQRIGAVDLGTLTWSLRNTNTFYASFSAKGAGSDGAIGNIICAKYATSTYGKAFAGTEDKIVGINSDGVYLCINDTAYTNAATFKSAMNGVMLCYEMATPVETDVDLNLTYKADDFGTEELLPANGSTPTTSPLTGSVLYPLNAVDTVRNLPRNYVSLATFDKLRAALAPWFVVSRTWNAAAGDYNVTATQVGGLWQHDLYVKNGADEHLYLTALTADAAVVSYDNAGETFSGLADGRYAAVSTEYGAGVAVMVSGVLTFFYGSSQKTWDGSGGVTDVVTKLY